jgi:adenine-specific DNA-methyltransferase
MTELVWDGKYKDGKRQGPVRIALPFQSIETVNESTQERQRSLKLFAGGHDVEWRNRLVWGDKKYVLASLLPEFEGKVHLVYIDPPFDTGADFSFTATISAYSDGAEEAATTFTREPSILEQKAYRDTWERGLDSYLQWFYEAVVLLRDLLAEDGSIYVHLDWHVAAYAKGVMDEVFGSERLVNEIVWKRSDAKGDISQGSRHFSRVHDVILYYAKTENAKWNPLYKPLSKHYVENFYKYEDPDGRRWKMDNMLGPGGAAKGNPVYEVMGVSRAWRYSKKRMEEMIKAGRVIQTKPGNVPMEKRYLDESKGVQVSTWWDDISMVRGWSAEKTGYATQKPEELLERIIEVSSDERGLILDCFVGSGTTPSVAEKLNRRWIACDLSRFAIHTTRKRLLGIPNVKPFVVQNLGKYERQAWQVAEFPANGKDHLGEQRQRDSAYRKFILDLYRATPLTGHEWLHGTKTGRMVHIGAVDAPVTLADVKAIAKETWKALSTGKDTPTKAGADILGWEFAFELNELAKQVAAESRINVSFKKIPREVLDKKAIEQGDVRFFELGALSVDTKQNGREVTLKLKDFLIPTDDIPEEARKAFKHWSQLIDYWAVDWDYKADTFHNQWQAYHTRKESKIELETTYKYSMPGQFSVVVKVIDILGNDTTKTLHVTIKDKK